MSDEKYDTPDKAEHAFYRAFENRHLQEMMGVWDVDDENIVCVHPMSEELTGEGSISESWERIFTHAPKMKIRFDTRHRTVGRSLVIHIVHESFYLEGDDDPHPPVVATNVYRLTGDGWRMILHHASPTPKSAAAEKKQAGEPKTLH